MIIKKAILSSALVLALSATSMSAGEVLPPPVTSSSSNDSGKLVLGALIVGALIWAFTSGGSQAEEPEVSRQTPVEGRTKGAVVMEF